jgi:hypothetical protein
MVYGVDTQSVIFEIIPIAYPLQNPVLSPRNWSLLKRRTKNLPYYQYTSSLHPISGVLRGKIQPPGAFYNNGALKETFVIVVNQAKRTIIQPSCGFMNEKRRVL